MFVAFLCKEYKKTPADEIMWPRPILQEPQIDVWVMLRQFCDFGRNLFLIF